MEKYLLMSLAHSHLWHLHLNYICNMGLEYSGTLTTEAYKKSGFNKTHWDHILHIACCIISFNPQIHLLTPWILCHVQHNGRCWYSLHTGKMMLPAIFFL